MKVEPFEWLNAGTIQDVFNLDFVFPLSPLKERTRVKLMLSQRPSGIGDRLSKAPLLFDIVKSLSRFQF